MIKAILVIIVCAIIGAVAYIYLSPIILPKITLLLPQATTILADVPSKISGLVEYARENWQLVAGSVGSVSVIGGYVANYLYKRNLQKQEAINQHKLNEVTGLAINAATEKTELQSKYDTLQGQFTELKGEYEELSQLPKIVEAKDAELQKQVEQRRALAELNEDRIADTLYKKIQEGKKIK